MTSFFPFSVESSDDAFVFPFLKETKKIQNALSFAQEETGFLFFFCMHLSAVSNCTFISNL